LITVQGLDKAVKSGKLSSNERMVILMDEAHRSASGDSVKRIKAALPKTTWFGFTGTPNFYSDELNDVKTSKNISTHDIFGPRLHRYTIKDAIGDGNVLGFDVTYYQSSTEITGKTKLTEKEIEKEVYASLPYRQSIVQDIIDHWDSNASGPIEMGVRKPNQFQGLFAVSGKQAVAAYYNLFKEMAPNLRVAMTYSRDEDNGVGSSDLQAALKRAMVDYQKLYDTQDFLQSQNPERVYLNDISKRIARKKPYNRGNDKDRLDLIIVSDQLLTGFDSKYLNIIYMDKVLKEGMLIQAMSRTNRTINKNAKPHGKVRFFRKGELMEENVKRALIIYTKGGNDSISDSEKKSSKDEQKELFKDGILAPNVATKIEELSPKIERLKELSGDDFSQIPKSEKERLEFVNLGAQTNNQIQQLVQGTYAIGASVNKLDDDGNETGELISLPLKDNNQLSSLQARLNDVNELLPEKDKVDLTHIKVSVTAYATEIIDYDTLVELLNNYIDETVVENRNLVEKHVTSMNDNDRKEIDKVLDGIVDGTYKEHFDTETLKLTRKHIRTAQEELSIRRWSADRNYNGNVIYQAFELYLPGVDLNDNPQLSEKLHEIEDKENIGFFETYDFEVALLKFFESLSKNQYQGEN